MHFCIICVNDFCTKRFWYLNNFNSDKENASLLIHGYIGSDIWDIKKQIAKNIIKEDNMELYENSTLLKVVKYGYGECLALNRWFKLERQLWKIQIFSENESLLSFSVGVDTYVKRYHIHLENYTNNILVKNGDIVSVLFLQTSTIENVLMFAINGKQCVMCGNI